MSASAPARRQRTVSTWIPTLLLLMVIAAGSSACGFGSRTTSDDPAATLTAIRTVHDAYVAAINANQVDLWVSTLDEDVVYLVPNQRALVGKAAVHAWVQRYLSEVTTRWTKSFDDLQVSGDWAFGRYAYTASDSVVIRDPETDGGGTANDSGWGLVVYHRARDGSWRVARDAWGSDRPAR